MSSWITDEIVASLDASLRDHLLMEHFGSLEVVDVGVEAVSMSEAEEGPPFAKLEITLVLHMADSSPSWDVDDVLTIRRQVRSLTATVELPASVRFVPDEDDASEYEEDPLHA